MTSNDSPKCQSLLFYISKAPYASATASANIDILLTAAAFDQDITLVFDNEGIYQLLKNQVSSDIGIKNTAQVFPALELYDVHKVFVSNSALEDRGFVRDDLLIPVEIINDAELTSLIESVDQVFGN